jgi:hypothetical protein
MYLRWGDGKTTFDHCKGMLDHAVVGTYTASMTTAITGVSRA